MTSDVEKLIAELSLKVNDISSKINHIDNKVDNMIGLMQNYIEENKSIVKRIGHLENAIKPKVINGSNK